MADKEFAVDLGSHVVRALLFEDATASLRIEGDCDYDLDYPERGTSETTHLPAQELAAHLRELADFLDRAPPVQPKGTTAQ